jgi:hypothetical protein
MNSLPSAWKKHNATLGGHLDQVVQALSRRPGLVERNERLLKAYAMRQSELLERPQVCQALQPSK